MQKGPLLFLFYVILTIDLLHDRTEVIGWLVLKLFNKSLKQSWVLTFPNSLVLKRLKKILTLSLPIVPNVFENSHYLSLYILYK